MSRDLSRFSYSPRNSTAKRLRSSPESDNSGTIKIKKGESSLLFNRNMSPSATDNMEAMGKLIENLLDKKLSVLASKEDIRVIVKELDIIRQENKELKEEIKVLRNENDFIKEKMIDFENRARRNNLIFKGIQYKKDDNMEKVVKNFCAVNLGLRGENINVNRAHPLGGIGGPIIAHIPSDKDLKSILVNSKKLKGTKYFIHKDYSAETRKVRAKLFRLRKEITRAVGYRKMPVVHDRLIVNDCSFTWVEEKLVSGNEDGERKLSEILECDGAQIVKMALGKGKEDLVDLEA